MSHTPPLSDFIPVGQITLQIADQIVEFFTTSHKQVSASTFNEALKSIFDTNPSLSTDEEVAAQKLYKILIEFDFGSWPLNPRNYGLSSSQNSAGQTLFEDVTSGLRGARKFQSGKHGGIREHFYPMFELLEPELLRRVANVMTTGAEKYTVDNWKSFDDKQILDLQRHVFQHTVSFMAGDTSEDHLANAVCNIMFIMYFEVLGKKVSKNSEKSRFAELKTTKE